MANSFPSESSSVLPLTSGSHFVEEPANSEIADSASQSRSLQTEVLNHAATKGNSTEESADDTDDLEIRMAAAALSGLKQSASFFPYTYSYQLPGVHALSPTSSSTPQFVSESHQNFISRFVGLPIINQSINTISNAYEATKATNSVIKFSAETVESNIQYISNSVVDRLNPILGPVDRFACNQLDRLEKFIGTPNQNSSTTVSKATDSPLSVNMDDYFYNREHRAPEKPPSPVVLKQLKQMKKDRKERKEKKSSSWIGSMVMNNDTIRGLDYCLQWLAYSRNHIAGQVSLLKEYVSNGTPAIQYLAGSSSSEVPNQPTPPVSPGPQSLIQQVKREVAQTLRKVISVIGRYAAICLPEHARELVKGFILRLPERFALLNAQSTTSVTDSPLSNHSRVSSSSSISTLSSASGYSTPTLEAQNVMNLADEGDKMLEKVYAIFKQTKDVVGGHDYEVDDDAETVIGERTDGDVVGMDMT